MAETLKRNVVIFNLDPAAEYNEYKSDFGKCLPKDRHQGSDYPLRRYGGNGIGTKWRLVLLYGVPDTKSILV